MNKPCEYCGCDLPIGVDKKTRQQRSHHFATCKARPVYEVEPPAQQEPVAWGVDWGKAGDIPCVSIIKRLPGGGIEVVAVEYAPYSYTSPPAQRTWVGLTDEEAFQICVDCGCLSEDWLTLLDAIEAKLRSKNT